MQVKIYWHKPKQMYSVMDAKSRKVLFHCKTFLLYAVRFTVSQAGRKRVLKQHRRNVHAYVCGHLVGYNGTFIKGLDPHRTVKYNPYKFHSFYDAETNQAVYSCAELIGEPHKLTII